MKKDLTYYENGIKEGSILDLGIKPGQRCYIIYDKCNGIDCPYNGGFGSKRCGPKSGMEKCKSYYESTIFQYYLIPDFLDGRVVSDEGEAIEITNGIKELKPKFKLS